MRIVQGSPPERIVSYAKLFELSGADEQMLAAAFDHPLRSAIEADPAG